MGNLLDRKETSSYLKEVLVKCNLTSNSFILLEPNPNDTLSKGYKVRITASMNDACRKKLRIITKRHSLAVIEEQNQIIVYKPKSTQISEV